MLLLLWCVLWVLREAGRWRRLHHHMLPSSAILHLHTRRGIALWHHHPTNWRILGLHDTTAHARLALLLRWHSVLSAQHLA